MVTKLSSAEIIHFLLILLLILIPARFFGEICRRFKLPAIIGEIFAGIIVGPTLLGTFFPDLFKSLFIDAPKAAGAFDGIGTGVLNISNGSGGSCSGTTFSWGLLPQP